MNYKKEETPDLTEISFRQGKSNMELAHSRFNEIFTSKVYPIGEGGELKPGDCVADVKNICWFAHTNTHTHTHARDTHTHTHTHTHTQGYHPRGRAQNGGENCNRQCRVWEEEGAYMHRYMNIHTTSNIHTQLTRHRLFFVKTVAGSGRKEWWFDTRPTTVGRIPNPLTTTPLSNPIPNAHLTLSTGG